MNRALRRATEKYITPMSEAELACRIIEAMIEVKRPPGATPEQALASVDGDLIAGARRAARSVMEYLAEQIANGSRVQ